MRTSHDKHGDSGVRLLLALRGRCALEAGDLVKLSAEGLTELKRYESCRLDAYTDEGGVWTIGYGDTGIDVHQGLTITQVNCDERLARRLLQFETAVQHAVKRPMKQGQFDAFVSLAYNIGIAAFSGSTMLAFFNQSDEAEAARQFGRWIHVNKVVSPNLVKRRFSEVVRFFL
jgi:lysozyme